MKHSRAPATTLVALLFWLSSSLHHVSTDAFHTVVPYTTTNRARRRRAEALSVSFQQVDDNSRSQRKSRRRSSASRKDSPSNSLTFRDQIVKTSRPLVSAQDRDLLIDFFQSPQARDTLFVSDAPPVPVEPVPSSLLHAWQTEAQSLGAVVPTNNPHDTEHQTVMQLCSNGIKFSGLTVETTVFCGGKLVVPDSTNNDDELPYYEFTMIKDQTQARGPRALMWIYNQVMGFVSNNNNRRNNQPKTTTSLCRITLAKTDNTSDNNSNGLALHFESSFQVQMRFPSMLLKVMPVSKSKAEQQGSAAVSGFVQKGVVDSLQRFETAFLQYKKQQHRAGSSNSSSSNNNNNKAAQRELDAASL